jgi:hypothetical protein
MHRRLGLERLLTEGGQGRKWGSEGSANGREKASRATRLNLRIRDGEADEKALAWRRLDPGTRSDEQNRRQRDAN